MSKQFPASLENLAPILAYVRKCALESGFATADHIELAVEEVITNIIEHSGSDTMNVKCTVLEKVRGVSVMIMDQGKAFNPLEHVQEGIDSGKGLGIFLTKKLMDSVEYRRENNCNVLLLTKFLPTA
jgi:anti-sigma regulatory factor (Ser/Thr protein kinase)